MRSRGWIVAAGLVLLSGSNVFAQHDDRITMRGDVNNDYKINLSDVVYLNSYLYSGGPAPPCLNQADANDNGVVDMSDGVFLSSWLYSGGSAPPAPGPFNTVCTSDMAPYPGCALGCN